MHYEGKDFDNSYTVGETKAVLAPLFETNAEAIHGYIAIYIGMAATGEQTIGVISNDEHPGCRIGLLAKVIELIAHETDDSDA